MGGSATTEVSANELIRERIVNEALTDAGTDHLEASYLRIWIFGRRAGGQIMHIWIALNQWGDFIADGTTSGIDFVGR